MRIFRGNGNAWMTAEDLSTEAILRGYRSTHSRNPENDPEKIRVSFRVILKREKEVFEQDGRGFRLREEP